MIDGTTGVCQSDWKTCAINVKPPNCKLGKYRIQTYVFDIMFYEDNIIFLLVTNYVVFILGICELPPETGPCRRNLKRYHFDRATGKCKEFTYGGCLGNANRFETKTECKERCGGKLNFVFCY